ncbi:TetR/AcrR family transcriptional regulator [Lentzea sp. BCCO 10_0856]|uniref:TetR/AcrR family transcriptional regulator n=1 Tax=Lentzea miocenica TaxID=3095431 RepID=A0ABU4T872_9PSEU|nr:TetR/AcrR family transcriptional regulator [Lentzea sp. BCCO 10_0856]MDX8034363.1 TetR/AcrR family transcriptional regulator [Lentzea sp. BCCO 10_0856]
MNRAGSRRKRSKGDLTSQAILDTAEQLLETRALDDIAVDELTSGAGISRSTFYFHFESREAVLLALSERITDSLYDSAVLWLRRGSEPPADSIRRAIAGTVALWRAHGPVLRAAVRARDTSELVRGFWSGVARRFIESSATQIEIEREAGVALPGPPTARALATVLISMNESMCYRLSLSRKSAARDREVVDTLTAVWLRAVYGVPQ